MHYSIRCFLSYSLNLIQFCSDKMAALSLRRDLAKEVNGHFLENDYGDLSFFLLFCIE